MGLFSKRRSDGKLVQGGDPMIHIMPYIMRGRNESAIYYRDTIDISHIQEFIRSKRREGVRITFFNIIITSLLHLIFERPQLNRFVSGRRLYDHNTFDILYVVKSEISDEGTESMARVSFDQDDDLYTITEAMKESIEPLRQDAERPKDKWDDRLIKGVSHFPRWLLRGMASCIRWLDFHGYLPQGITRGMPLYCSVVISHLGSIGGGAPFHHLYEFGTSSIFVTLGKMYDMPCRTANNELEWHRVVDLCFTIDERICDGYYMIKSLKYLDKILQTPELLELSPAKLKSLSKEEIKQLYRSYEGTPATPLQPPLKAEEISDKRELYD